MKKDSNLPIIILFVILGAIILAGGYYLYSTSKPPQPGQNKTVAIPSYSQNDSQPVDTSLGKVANVPKFEWLTYTNDDHGYGFQYPNTWKLAEQSGGLTLANQKNATLFSVEIIPESYEQARKKLGTSGVAEGDLNTSPVVIEQKENKTVIYTFASKNESEVIQVTLNAEVTTDEVENSLLQQVMATVHKL